MALALTGCVTCNGIGLSDQKPCNCVLRSVFRIVLNKVHECSAGGHLRPIQWDGARGPQNRQGNGRVYEDFAADAYLIAKRTLTEPNEWDVFRFHYLLGADWKLCCQRLHINRGACFHLYYRIEQKLGNAFATTEPYALFPVDECFQRTTRRVDIRPLPVPAERQGISLHPPLRAPQAQPDPYELVKAEIRQLYSQGHTLTEISRYLNSRGILPKRALRFYPATVRTIILRAPREEATLSKKAA